MLGGVGLGNMWCNTLGLTLILAFDTGLQVLASQAFGRDDHKLVGVYYQRGLIILAIVMFVMAFGLAATKPLCLSLGMDAEVVEYSFQYTLNMFPGLWLTGFYDATKNYLNA